MALASFAPRFRFGSLKVLHGHGDGASGVLPNRDQRTEPTSVNTLDETASKTSREARLSAGFNAFITRAESSSFEEGSDQLHFLT